jgi:hypothetical protein
MAKRGVHTGVRSRQEIWSWLANSLLWLWFARPRQDIRKPSSPRTDELSLSSLTLVAMVKSSHLRNCHDAPAFWLFHYSRLWSVLGQR